MTVITEHEASLAKARCRLRRDFRLYVMKYFENWSEAKIEATIRACGEVSAPTFAGRISQLVTLATITDLAQLREIGQQHNQILLWYASEACRDPTEQSLAELQRVVEAMSNR